LGQNQIIEKPADVRLAVEADRPALVDLTTLLHGENGLFSLSLKKRDALLDRYFAKQGSIIGVIGEVGAPVATIYLALTQPEYTDDWALVEVWNFVADGHRQSTHAKHLIEYAKFMSTEMKLPLIIGILSNHRTEAKVRLYERTLDKVGAYFIWNQHLAGGAWGSA
jgi:hypothetical protein